MDARYIALAIPAFILLIGVELLMGFRRGDSHYRFHDMINSLSCGIGQQVTGLASKIVEIAGYALVYEHFRVATVPSSSLLGWVVLLFAVDLCYYVYHLVSHRVNFFWATHAVHHQSEEYNLSTALRQSWFTQLTSWIFYLPLAVAGFSPEMFVVMHTLNTLYQFWIHTRAVKRLGFLEAFLNTPSHHRVHHGIDPIYIDKNYAGIFIIWDKLFGTFQPEVQEPVYGTVKPLASWNPLWANVEPWVLLAGMARRTRRLRDKLAIWFMPPEWRPLDLGGRVVIPEVNRATHRVYDTKVARGLDAYVAVSFVFVVGAITAMLWYEEAAPAPVLAITGALIVASLLVWGGLFEAKRWAAPLEWARLAASAACVAWLARGTAVAAEVAVGAVVGSALLAIWVGRYRGRGVEPAAGALEGGVAPQQG